MFLQKKEYIQLFRGNEKLMTAGLCKLVIWDQKIKIDYYMDHLPLTDQTKGICHLIYLVRKEGEQNLLRRESAFPFLFSKSKYHYAFQLHEIAAHQIVKIENCYLEMDKQYMIYMHGYPQAVQPGQQSPEQEREKQQTADRLQIEKTAEKQREKQAEHLIEKQSGEQKKDGADSRSDVQGGDFYASEKDGNDTGNHTGSDVKSKMTDTKEYPVRRIDDLKELLAMGEAFVELYYNSFLLHSFYQYRHLLLGKNFLAVPGYFYEREAIAAKMMGFPYFIEAAKVDLCSMSGETRTEKPTEGTYGYFLRQTETTSFIRHRAD